MEINYSSGPRYIDGINIDADVSASEPKIVTEQEISDSVTGLNGLGYQPGQENKDGSPM
jgi:hypothetical protein